MSGSYARPLTTEKGGSIGAFWEPSHDVIRHYYVKVCLSEVTKVNVATSLVVDTEAGL
jgi:hypothetical protein